MKTVDIADFQLNMNQYLDALPQETIVITRQGRPCAVLHGVSEDLETAELMHSTEFWHMIEKRRREPTIPWDEAKRDLN